MGRAPNQLLARDLSRLDPEVVKCIERAAARAEAARAGAAPG